MDEKKDQLQTDLLFINNELQAERQKGAEGDATKITQLEQRKADVQYQLDGINKAEKEQAIEEKIHSEITFAIPGVDFTQLPVELINIIHAVVKADRRKNLSEHSAELEQIENERDAWVEENGKLIKENYDLQQECQTAARELKEQTAETVRLIAERDDARKNRDNAAAQLEEAKAEIARLESQVDDYQKAKVLGERQAQAVIDVTPNEAEEINAAIKTFLKSEDWGSIIKVVKPDESFELVKRDVFEKEWTAITPPPLLGGSDNGAATFQGETVEANAEVSGVLAPEVPVLDFRPQEESNASGLPVDENGTLRSDDEPATWAELKALEARIDERLSRLEQSEVAVA
ncbi:hypothetical protein L1N85_10770 [Paenibacillus alkaliterrae]|uniref:hypothetical protein n=1 Tax=Paenibacillus alkaliterrae TaxID=320909 RepID=UPI001F45CF6F|nr:hypothetical protein [Paenibacillus alkaliterrae]MCF2938918.1 hypothetical protein [Paenibacillus alkaliterrae]